MSASGVSSGFTVDEILAWTQGRLVNGAALGGRAREIRVKRPAQISGAGTEDVAFFFNPEFKNELPACRAGVLITGEPFVGPLEASGLPVWKSAAVIACSDPYWAMAVLSGKFAAQNSTAGPTSRPDRSEIHPTAVIHASARIGDRVRIGPFCVIDEGARVGTGSVLYAGCTVGPGAEIGEDAVFFPGVTIYEQVKIGNRARLHAGVRIGSDGFGYAKNPNGPGHQKIYHMGRVVIGDDVEIGANSCVDRGTIADTVIGNHAKLDNQVHIGHNAKLDEGAVICGGTCLAGSASIGKYCYVGGLSGIANKAHVGDGASVGALTLVTKDVAPGSTAVGNPQRDYRAHFRAHAALNKLAGSRKKRETPKEVK